MVKSKNKKAKNEDDIEKDPVQNTNDNNDDKNKSKGSKVEESNFDLAKENKYLVAGFKVSKYYHKDLESKDLENAFEEYKKESRKTKKNNEE